MTSRTQSVRERLHVFPHIRSTLGPAALTSSPLRCRFQLHSHDGSRQPQQRTSLRAVSIRTLIITSTLYMPLSRHITEFAKAATHSRLYALEQTLAVSSGLQVRWQAMKSLVRRG